ncbi:MAG: hypothetical protein ACI4NG_06125 [Candidatus Gallimonas sp.]
MLKFFTEKDVRKLVARLKEEYAEIVQGQREVAEELKRENAALRARLSVLEGERADVSAALVRAVGEETLARSRGEAETENERKELRLLSEKCRLLCDRLLRKYPDEEDCLSFAEFTEDVRRRLGEETSEEETVFDMDEVLAPKKPLDLEKLCKDLGVMEEE